MSRLLNAVDSISEWTGKIISPLVLIILVICLFEVIARYVFNRPTLWAWESVTYMMAIMVALSGVFTLLHKGHVSVDTIYVRFNERTKAIIDIVTFLLVFTPFISVMLWNSIDFAWGSFLVRETSTTTWKPPIWPIKWVLPLAFTLMQIQGLAIAIRRIPVAFSRKKTGASGKGLVDLEKG